MKLATLKSSHSDGQLIVVSSDHQHFVKVSSIASSFREALDLHHNGSGPFKRLQEISVELNEGKRKDAHPLNENLLHSPLPRTYGWLDGSAYIQHILLVRKARNVEPPASLKTVPLMYQGGSDTFLAPREEIPLIHSSHGLDFEAEIGVITDHVPMGTKSADAHNSILFLVLINDITLRGLVPGELGQGFGFMQSKPSSSFAPFALTPDELGESWRDSRIYLPLLTQYNGKFFGNPDAGEMHFSFSDLIEHAARTRSLSAGTIIGSGTVSNKDMSRGSSCLAEKRMIEQIYEGEIKTPFMQVGDQVRIEMKNKLGQDLFGIIEQKVVQSSVSDSMRE